MPIVSRSDYRKEGEKLSDLTEDINIVITLYYTCFSPFPFKELLCYVFRSYLTVSRRVFGENNHFRFIFGRLSWKLLQYRCFDLSAVGVLHLTLGLFLNLVRFLKLDTPLEEQLEPGFHRMATCFHHDEVTFWHGL